MAKKLLIIGLGSQGYSICERLATKIEARYGTLDRVPWVRILAFETKPVSATHLGTQGKAFHLDVSRQRMTAMKEAPPEADPLDLAEWLDWGMLGSTDEIQDGANNIRAAGRLVFLESRNFGTFMGEVHKALVALGGLTNVDAQEKLGRLADGNFAAVQLEEMIQVYVVGALTGGTASGSFVDVGYAIRSIRGFEDKTFVDGIFGVPNSAYPNAELWANTYAALTEANHYQYPRSRYRARFASQLIGTDGRVDHQGLPPYRRLYLTQPRNAIPERGLPEMNNGIAEYLDLLAFEPQAGEIEANATNAFGKFAARLDRFNRIMRYGTLGVSVVEFPAEHIIEACGCRAIEEALAPWVAPRNVPEELVKSIYTTEFRLDTDSIRTAVEKSTVAQRVWKSLENDAQNALNGMKSDEGSLERFEGTLKRKLEVEIHNGVGSLKGEFFDACKEASKNLADTRIELIEGFMQSALLNKDKGPQYVRNVLEEVLRRMDERIHELGEPSFWTNVKANYDSTTKTLSDMRPGSKNSGCIGGLFGGKAKAEAERKRAEADYLSQTSTVIRTFLTVSLGPIEIDALKGTKKRAEELFNRLDDNRYGFVQWAEALLAHFSSRHREMAAAGPDVNGELLFTPQTVGAEYDKMLPTLEDRAALHAKTLASLKPQVQEIFVARPGCSFERAGHTDDKGVRSVLSEERDRLRAAVRPSFKDIANDHVLDRLISPHNAGWMTTVTSALDKADVVGAVDWNGHPAHVPVADNTDHRLKSFSFFEHVKADAEKLTTKAGQLAQHVRQRNFIVKASESRHTIVFIQAAWIFAAESLAGIATSGKSNYAPRAHARVKVDWRSLDGRPRDVNSWYRIGLVLTGFALGVVSWRQNRLVYSTTARMGQASKDELLPRELEDAARALDDKHLTGEFGQRLRAEIDKLDASGIAQRCDAFANQCGAYGLTFEGQPVQGRAAVDLLLHYVDTLPGVVDAWREMFPSPPDVLELTTESRRKIAGEDVTLPPGFYCPRCVSLLGTPGTEVDALSSRCPSCDWLIRV